MKNKKLIIIIIEGMYRKECIVSKSIKYRLKNNNKFMREIIESLINIICIVYLQ